MRQQIGAAAKDAFSSHSLYSLPVPPTARDRFYLIGNRLAIDFANSIITRAGTDPLRGTWDDFIEFLETIGAVSEYRANLLRQTHVDRPKLCREIQMRALDLRVGIRNVLDSLAAGQIPGHIQVEYINRILQDGEGYPWLHHAPHGRYHMEFEMRKEGPLRALLTITQSIAELIIESSSRIKRCAGPKCKLYFYDISRRQDRRWCSMQICGNRAKVAAHARRNRDM
jgi:predicted RNA-binding Zn ribbon-like protein